jgi:hypothetical protein
MTLSSLPHNARSSRPEPPRRPGNSPTIGCCWVADQLDLGRVGIEPDAKMMSTEAGRKRTLKRGSPLTASLTLRFRGCHDDLSLHCTRREEALRKINAVGLVSRAWADE